MGLDATRRRRFFGGAVLLIALAMLVAGETLLRERLQALGFLIYWLVCFVFTGLAVLVAFADVRSLRDRSRREERELLQDALKDIQSEAKARHRQPGSTDPR